jgi:hypothetical protein
MVERGEGRRMMYLITLGTLILLWQHQLLLLLVGVGALLEVGLTKVSLSCGGNVGQSLETVAEEEEEDEA